MPEWWTYRLSDFLLFSPRTYYRMIERLNESAWPAHLLTLALGCTILALALGATMPRLRVVWTTLALLWLWTGWAFLWRRYAAINWAAAYVAPLFVLQALLLLMEAFGRATGGDRGDGRTRAAGLVLFIAAIALYPLIAPLVGRGWEQAEVFGIEPDPTAIATLGMVLMVPSRGSGRLMVIPVVWCLISGLTLWAMESPEAWLPPAAALLSLLFSRWQKTDSAAASEGRTLSWHPSN
jgi:uncharacterized membrane protein YozB (DUF420 family)